MAHAVGVAIEDSVVVADVNGAPITGVAASLTAALYSPVNGFVINLVVTEIGGVMVYYAPFVPDTGGCWKVRWSSSNAAHYFENKLRIAWNKFDVQATGGYTHEAG